MCRVVIGVCTACQKNNFDTLTFHDECLLIVLSVLKKNYTRLCRCLPQDYVKTVDKLRQLIPVLPADYLDLLRTVPSIEGINEVIVGSVMTNIIREDDDVLQYCDIMEMLCCDTASKSRIQIIRKGMYYSSLNG